MPVQLAQDKDRPRRRTKCRQEIEPEHDQGNFDIIDAVRDPNCRRFIAEPVADTAVKYAISRASMAGFAGMKDRVRVRRY